MFIVHLDDFVGCCLMCLLLSFGVCCCCSFGAFVVVRLCGVLMLFWSACFGVIWACFVVVLEMRLFIVMCVCLWLSFECVLLLCCFVLACC